MSQERLIPAPPKFEGYSSLFVGGTMRSPGDGVVLLGGASEETAGCGFPWPYPWLVLTLMGFTPGDGEERSLMPMSGPVPAGQVCCPGHIRHISCNKPSKGKQFEIRQTGEQLPKGMKISLFHA